MELVALQVLFRRYFKSLNMKINLKSNNQFI